MNTDEHRFVNGFVEAIFFRYLRICVHLCLSVVSHYFNAKALRRRKCYYFSLRPGVFAFSLCSCVRVIKNV